MRVLLHTENTVNATAMSVLGAAKVNAGISEEIEFGYLGEDQIPPSNATVLALGAYKRRNGERVVQTYSVPQIVTKPDALSRVARAFKLLSGQPKLPDFEYEVIDTGERFWEVISALDKSQLLVFDVETSGDITVDYFNEVNLLCYSFCQEGTPQYVVAESLANDPELLGAIAEFSLCGHNLSFDVKVINAVMGGLAKARIGYDTMLGHWIFYPASDAGLKGLALSYLGVEDWDSANKQYTVTKTYKEHTDLEDGAYASARKYSAGSGYERIPRTMLYEYCARDTFYTRELFHLVDDLLATSEPKQEAMATRVAMANMYMDMEVAGTRVDIGHLYRLKEDLEEERVRIRRELNEIAGQEINPNSPKQVMSWFKDNGAKFQNSSEKHLELEMRKDNVPPVVREFVEKLWECRGNTKALGTYVDATILKSRDGVIHPSFKLHGVATGRLSTPGKGTGLMTIPREDKYRQMVIPKREGHVLVKPDYGQLEGRVTAVLSGDQRYIDAFQPGSPDFFISLLPSVYPDKDFSNMPKDEIKVLRQEIKPFSHGAHYGRGAKAIAEQLDMPEHRAKVILENYLGDHDKGLRKWQTDIRAMAVGGMQIETPFGLHLQSEIVTHKNRVNVENTALSFLPQSIGNSICVKACLRIHEWIGEYGDAHLFLTVHDQILASVPIEHAKAVGERMEYEMVKAGRETFGDVIIFEAAPEYGFDWAHKMEPEEWDEYLETQR